MQLLDRRSERRAWVQCSHLVNPDLPPHTAARVVIPEDAARKARSHQWFKRLPPGVFVASHKVRARQHLRLLSTVAVMERQGTTLKASPG